MEVKFSDGSTEEYDDTPFDSGGQGELFRSRKGQHVVKLYKTDPIRLKELIDRIDMLIKEFNPTKDPYWLDYFAWPDKRVVVPKVGLRMPYVPPPLKRIDFHLPLYYPSAYEDLPLEERGWFIGRMAVAIKLACAANRLAGLGLCYADFSEKNIMVDPFEGKMRLIDCDSLFVPDRLSLEVLGTGFYRAPEIFTRAISTPSLKTDRHALAVILYLWLVGYHPLDGDKVFAEASDYGDDATDVDPDELLRYGTKALYIEHPRDASNRLLGQAITAKALGPELEKLFQDAFVKGLHNPDERPSPHQWQQVLIHTYDRIVPCASKYCDWRFFVATAAPRLTCPSCQEPLRYPRTLPFVSLYEHGGSSNPEQYSGSHFHQVVGWPGRNLYEWHVKAHCSPIPSRPMHRPDMTPMAAFEYDPRKQEWYLKNKRLATMRFRIPGDAPATWRTWPANTSIPLETGMLIQFGTETEYARARVKIEEVG